MASFNKEELLHIAHLSALKLDDKEIDLFVDQIKTILGFVDQLKEVKISTQAESVHNVNIFREDTAIKTDASAIMEQAPVVDGPYFAVPKILDEK